MTSKCSSSPKCARIRRAVGSALEVATASRTPAARRSSSSAGMPVEQAVHRPAAGGVVGPVGGDRLVGVLAEAHLAQRVMHRRTDDQAGQVAVGHRGADLAQRVPEAGHDALRRVGQGAVEVEDHQLRARRDGTVRVSVTTPFSRRTTVVLWRVNPGVRRALPRRPGRGARHAGLRRQRPRRPSRRRGWSTGSAARLTDLGRYPSAADEAPRDPRRRRQARTQPRRGGAARRRRPRASRCWPTCGRGWPR